LGVTPGVSEKVLDGLRRTKGWVRFSGILMVIMFALQALNLILVAGGLTASGAGSGAAYAIGAGFGGLIFGILFFLWPAMRLLAYSKAIGRLLETKSAAELEEAMNAQRGFWKHMGIIMLIYIVLTVVAMVVFIAFASRFAASMGR
jgi:hypothetical protein